MKRVTTAAMLVLVGCAADETAILLRVCTNLSSAQADELRIVVASGGESGEKSYRLAEVEMPFEISLRPGPKIRGAIDVTALLSLGDSPVVSRTVQSTFVTGSDADLTIFLDRACIDWFCPSELTCTARDCVSPGGGDADCVGTSVPGLDAAAAPGEDAGTLPDSGWEPDGGSPCPGCPCDSDGDCGAAEVCLDRTCTTQCSTDADCPFGDRCIDGFCGCPPGLVDCWGDCVDPTDDPENCGSCDWVCEPGDVCEDGQCFAF